VSVVPQFLPASTIIQYNPIAQSALGTQFRTHSFFFNDAWRAGNHVTLNLGLRWDKNHARTAAATSLRTTARGARAWASCGIQRRWPVVGYGSFAKYVAGISSSIADSSTAAAIRRRCSGVSGAGDHPAGTASLVPTDQAIQQLFNWFFGAGGTKMAPSASSVPASR